MTSNIKKRPDYVRLFLAISSILVLLVLVFTACNGVGLDIAKLVGAMPENAKGMEGLLGELRVFSVSILDLMLGFTVGGSYESEGGGLYGPVVVNGLRAAFILLIIAIVIAAVIVYGILSKKFNYKTLKILAITNAVIMIAVGTLILCAKPLIAAEVKQLYGGDLLKESIKTTLQVETVTQFIMKYFKLCWGAIVAGSIAIVSALTTIGTLIYAKKNKLEI